MGHPSNKGRTFSGALLALRHSLDLPPQAPGCGSEVTGGRRLWDQ